MLCGNRIIVGIIIIKNSFCYVSLKDTITLIFIWKKNIYTKNCVYNAHKYKSAQDLNYSMGA